VSWRVRHEGVDAAHARAGGENVLRDVGEPVPPPGRTRGRLDVEGDPLSQGCVDAPPVVAPRQLRDEFLRLLGACDAGQRRVADLRQGEDAVTDPRGEAGNRPRDVVAGAGVGDRIDRRQGAERGLSAALRQGRPQQRRGRCIDARGKDRGEGAGELVAAQARQAVERVEVRRCHRRGMSAAAPTGRGMH